MKKPLLRQRFLYLKAVVLLIVFGKILLFRSGRHTLQRIVAEPSAMMGGRDDAAFSTDHLIVVHLTGEHTAAAVSLRFFTKQHVRPSFRIPLYTISLRFSRGYFYKDKEQEQARHGLRQS